MFADRRHQGLERGLLALGQASDILLPEPLDSRIAAALEPVLEPRDVLADLIDHRQLLGKRQQPRIGRGVRLPYRSRARREQSGTDLFALAPLRTEYGSV